MSKKKQKKQKKQFAPIITMLVLIAVVAIGSSICSMLNMEGSKTSIVNGTLETSIIVVKNVFSQEGIHHFFTNVLSNFNLLQPLVLILISLMAMSIGKTSGFFKNLFTPLKKLKPHVLTFLVILVSVISTVIGDYSYIVLLPLIAILYEYTGKSPVLGIITVFIGITLGYGTGLFYNYDDYLLGMLTQNAAVIDVDATYQFNLYSNLFIMIVSTIAISIILTFLVEKYLSKKVINCEKYEDELLINRKAFFGSFASIILLLVFIGIGLSPLSGVLLDTNQTYYVAKIFGDAAPFNNAFIFIVLLIMAVAGLVYGIISKNFKNNHEYCWGFTKQFDNIGYLIMLMFLSSILIGIIDWTNIGVVIANKLTYLLSVLSITGIPLIIITFFFVIIMSIFLPNTVEKWILISPVLIPLFMRSNLTPDFAQFVFKVADSVGKIITPVFVFFIIMVGFIQKYNGKENKITLFGTFKLIWPIVITMIIFWLLLLIIWYVAGLPIGIGIYATM